VAVGSSGPSDVLVSREIRIGAAPRTVFDFLVDPAKLVRWMGIHAVLDPRPGGIYHVDVNGHETVTGYFVEVVPFTRVVFTWGWDDGAMSTPPGSTVVEIELEPDGEDTCLRLTHRDLAQEMRSFHLAGWQHYLSRLAMAAAGGDPGPDPHTTTIGTMRLGMRHLSRRFLYRFPRMRVGKWLGGRRRSAGTDGLSARG
jgi:uncharacterized protein YndB with AHSA1/START domain